MNGSPASVVEAAFRPYRSQDRAAALPLYADDFTFTSPQDDHIDKAAFFERCFPTADRLAEQRLLQVVAVEGDHRPRRPHPGGAGVLRRHGVNRLRVRGRDRRSAALRPPAQRP
ncbi:hypothetical protein ABT187_29325 [Streptomyces sp. NPDC001817]|uniref:hypothetical protein n=1 Tax=Streptomyces sp. NPDC001817 TaxID=3154398 RepID=UPI00332A0DFC